MSRREKLHLEGTHIPGIGTVATLPERNWRMSSKKWLSRERNWWRKNSTKVRVTADIAAGFGLSAVSALSTVKTGTPLESAGAAVAATALFADAYQGFPAKGKSHDENFLLEAPRGRHLKGIGLLPPLPEKTSRFREIIRHPLINAGYFLGTPGVAFLTVELIRSKNFAEATITGAADVILIANFRRRRKVLSHIDASAAEEKKE